MTTMKCLFCGKKFGSIFKKPVPPAERLFAKVRVGSRCWMWTGSKDHKGYGRLTMHLGHIERAHRVAWAVSFGKVGKKQILHSCDTPSCVRPSHLFIGTHLDNMRDMFAKGRRIAAVGKKNGKAKLTPQVVKKITLLYSEGKGSIVAL